MTTEDMIGFLYLTLGADRLLAGITLSFCSSVRMVFADDFHKDVFGQKYDNTKLFLINYIKISKFVSKIP